MLDLLIFGDLCDFLTFFLQIIETSKTDFIILLILDANMYSTRVGFGVLEFWDERVDTEDNNCL